MIALTLLCLLPGQLPTLESKDFSKEVQQTAVTATVRIGNVVERADGSGVLLRQDELFLYVLTANHVAGKAKELDVYLFTAASYPAWAKAYKGAEVLARDARADLAVIRIITKDAVPAPLVLCPANKAPDGKGTTVLTVSLQADGSPMATPDVVKTVRVIGKPGETGTVKCWETAKAPLGGQSGGPLIDTQGRVIGIASGTSGGKGYYIHLEEIRSFLKRKGLDKLIEKADLGAPAPHPVCPLQRGMTLSLIATGVRDREG
jgi:S1-C subfamily serine protease